MSGALDGCQAAGAAVGDVIAADVFGCERAEKRLSRQACQVAV